MIHLHCRSCYSFLESPLRLQEIIRMASETGSGYAVLSDHKRMHAVPEFLRLCKEHSLQPVIGLELEAAIGQSWQSFLLIARNERGLSDLYRLSSRLLLKEENPTLQELKEYTSDCFVLTLGLDQFLLEALERSEQDEKHPLQTVREFLKSCKGLFEDFYVTESLNDSSTYARLNPVLLETARSLNIESVAVHQILYAKSGQENLLRALQAISLQKPLTDLSIKVRNGRYWLSSKEMEALYDSASIQNTDRIAARIHYDFSGFHNHLPLFDTGSEKSSAERLKELCHTGLRFRRKETNQEYLSRLEYELKTICSMGFEDYFLIVCDLLREAKRRKIAFGPGRGSAAGSLVSWCLGISQIDPVANGLLFERFLNPERISMPDIDLDFPDERREEMILYLFDKYGHEHVSHIAAFFTMQAKGILRDLARVMGIAEHEVSALTSMIKGKQSVREAYDTNPAFRSKADYNRKTQELVDYARELEGLPRHCTTHAAGIVLSREPIFQVAPLCQTGAKIPTVQFSMEHLEALGLIKFDLLSIRNLTIIERSLEQIQKKFPKFRLERIPLDDPKVFDLFQKGRTLGIFQMESDGIRNLSRNYHPVCFPDLAAILALYRPGPMQNINLFLQARRSGSMHNVHPLLHELLKETSGIFLYQEQIMKAAQIIGGFSLAQADLLRKAMSKKNKNLMEQYRLPFLQGAMEKGMTEKEAQDLYDTMERFTEYGFNKSHSYAYALVSYQMAYLKTHFPGEFYSQLLNSCLGDPKKTRMYLAEMKQAGVPVLDMDIMLSSSRWTSEDAGVRIPFSLLRGLNPRHMEALARIQEESPKAGLNDVFILLSLYGFDERAMKVLIKAGAFSRFGTGPATLMNNLYFLTLMADLSIIREDQVRISQDVISDFEMQPAAESEWQQMRWQTEALGFSYGTHPLERIRRQHPGAFPLGEYQGRKGRVHVVAQIIAVRRFQTKNGYPMAFADLEDESGELSMAVMPTQYKQFKDLLEEEMVIEAQGYKNREGSFNVESMKVLITNPFTADPAGKVQKQDAGANGGVYS